MDDALQALVVETIRTLWASGLWWLALVLAVAFALFVVARRRGWILGPDSPVLPTSPLAPDPVEHPPSPPIPVPPDGVPVPGPGDLWTRNDP